MTAKAPVNPAYGSGVTINAAAATPSATQTIKDGTKQVILTNLGANPVHVHIGDPGVVAGADDYPVPAGAQVVVTRDARHNTIAYVSTAGTTLHVMSGEGF